MQSKTSSLRNIAFGTIAWTALLTIGAVAPRAATEAPAKPDIQMHAVLDMQK